MSKSIGWCTHRRIVDVWNYDGKYHIPIVLAIPTVRITSSRIIPHARTTCMEGHFRPWRKGG